MDSNTELLNFIFQNSEMGIRTTRELLEICKDEGFNSLLSSQHDEYSMLNDKAKTLIENMGKPPKDIDSISSATSYIMIKMNTLTDKSPSHISEMMMRGSNMGIIDIRKRLNQYKNVDAEITALAQKLLEFEERNVEELKKHL